MTLLCSYKSIHKSFGETPLFAGLDINIQKDERLGLIGGNGSGKSTLLKLLADLEPPEAGERYLQNLARVVYLPQEDVLDPEKTISEILFQALSSTDMEEQTQYRTVKQLTGTAGFLSDTQKCGELSGGWRKKLAIIRALAQAPDLLLLDEPTNHLDINGRIWLETLLKRSDFAFVVVSHDRCFLENTAHRIMEIGQCFPQGVLCVTGSYLKFRKHREKLLEEQQKQEQSLANKVRRENEWLSRGPKARATKARYRIDQAERLKDDLSSLKNRNQQTQKVDIRFNASSRRTKKLLVCKHVGKSMGGRPLFKDINIELTPGITLGLMGENGSGKTTLMKILNHEIQPDTGQIKTADQLKVAVFDQNRERLDPDITLKEALSPTNSDAVVYQGKSIHIVTWAKKFLFTPDQLVQPVRQLSGGEKARILIADLMLQPADVLLLDEPTNDLDIPSLEVLEQSILEFPGAVVLVSHDRFLLNNVTHSILYLDGHGNAEIFADYTQCLSRKKEIQKKQQPVKKDPPAKKKNALPVFSFNDKFELGNIEEKILSAETIAAEIESKTKDPDLVNHPEKMNLLYTDLTRAQEKIDRLYARWEDLEALKAASAKN